MPEASRRRRSPLLAIVGLIVLMFLVWGVWTWMNWGEAGMGVTENDSTARPAPAERPAP